MRTTNRPAPPPTLQPSETETATEADAESAPETETETETATTTATRDRPETMTQMQTCVAKFLCPAVDNLAISGSRRSFSIVGRAVAHSAERFGVRITQFSVQGNHIHLVVEATASEALSQAMQGFGIRVAKGLNGMMGRSDRYHARARRHRAPCAEDVAASRELAPATSLEAKTPNARSSFRSRR